MSQFKRRRSKQEDESSSNPVALAARVIAGIVTPLDGLDDEDKTFVQEEITWLFHAAKNFQDIFQTVHQQFEQDRVRIQHEIRQEERALLRRVGPAASFTMGKKQRLETERLEQVKPQRWQDAIKLSPHIEAPLPQETERTSTTNKILSGLSIFNLENSAGDIKHTLDLIEKNFQILKDQLDRGISMGETGKRNVQLQNEIKSRRTNILREAQKIADVFAKIYGVEITSPGDLADWLEEN